MSLERYFRRAHEEARAFCPREQTLQEVLDRAMVDVDSRPTLRERGDGAAACRLLTMVDWDRVPRAWWPEVFERFCEVLAGDFGPEGFDAAERARLQQSARRP
ncbi:hypothetical protein WME75_28225 [Sorangium sp. So ce1014]|uniref:hypothetical protein n=1 Tax=Sorangium sp. So ce1014 TaxID=3133326 RepID=UPI003F5D7F5F